MCNIAHVRQTHIKISKFASKNGVIVSYEKSKDFVFSRHNF